MALNLWKVGGQPTSFNPLNSPQSDPAQYKGVLVGLGDYTLIVKARSANNSQLRVADAGSQDINSIVTLTNKSAEYIFSFKSTAYNQFIYVIDYNVSNNIIIDSIELVQKPLPMLTLNGVDGFASGKWTLHANAVVVDDETLVLNATGIDQISYYTLPLLPNQSYYVSSDGKITPNGDGIVGGIGVHLFRKDGSVINAVWYSGAFTTPSDVSYCQVRFSNRSQGNGQFTFKRPMLTLGSSPIPYEKKRGDKMVLPVLNASGKYQANKLPKHAITKSRTGLSFNGVTDYLQLPSMTMDSIEIECLIDANNPSNYLIDARTGLSNGYVVSDGGGIGSGWSTVFVDGVLTLGRAFSVFPRNQRTKIKLIATNTFTDDVVFFKYTTLNAQFLKATLYKVTCYLNNAIVAQYDFENPRSIVGGQVLQNAQNLIPSFDDSRWGIHANAKVLGKDVLHLDASANSQYSYVDVNVVPNTIYLVGNGYGQCAVTDTITFAILNGMGYGNGFRSFNTGSNSKIRFFVSNDTKGTGSFDFIRPQLYALDGKEGTMNGSPTQGIKTSKRQLYAKR